MNQDTKDILEAPFAPGDIKKDYNGFDYVDPHLVIRRLNKARDQDGWQFILEERIEDDFEIIQFGKIGIKDEDGEWIWKHNCGGKRRTYPKGKDKIPENRLNSTNDYKSAISNCQKRCAMMLGVALDLYGPEEQDTEKAQNAPQGDNQSSGGTNNPGGEQRWANTGGSGSAEGGMDKLDESIGGIKNRLLDLEKQKKADGMTQTEITEMRVKHLGNMVLDHGAEKLTAYGNALAIHGDS